MHVIFYQGNALLPFVWDGEAEAGLHEAAARLGLLSMGAYEIRPMRHKSKRLALWDQWGNLRAIVQPIRNPLG